MIRSDSELSTICRDGSGVISQETIVKNHPFVTDYEKEMERIKKEKEDEIKSLGQYEPFQDAQKDNQDSGEQDET